MYVLNPVFNQACVQDQGHIHNIIVINFITVCV